MGIDVVLCKYGLSLEKLLSTSMREIILAMNFDSLLEPGSYIDVEDVVDYEPNWWKGNVDHESASWSEDLVGQVSAILEVE